MARLATIACVMETDAEERSRRSPRRRSPVSPGDAALALAIGVAQLGGTFLAVSTYHPGLRLGPLGFALLAAGPFALLVRRRFPGGVLLFAFATTLAYALAGYPRGPVFLALIAAFVNAVMRGRRALAWSTLIVGYASLLGLGSLLGSGSPPSPAALVGVGSWMLVLATTTEVVRARRQQGLERARAREEEARRRSGEERLRIAQELHDVLAHNISLINVQAGVALHLVDERPEQAQIALRAIKQASKEALDELRSVLDVLRHADDKPLRAPVSGLDQLDALVARTAAAGLPVRVATEGTVRPLPAAVDLAAFRTVQEALTNVVRHAGPTAATVRIAYGERDLAVQVDDDGRGSPSPRPVGGGNGIVGMRERAAALGGQLAAGPRRGGGFRVRARFPLEDAP